MSGFNTKELDEFYQYKNARVRHGGWFHKNEKRARTRLPGELRSDIAYIYIMVDPRTDDVRYVGSSVSPFVRFTDHKNKNAAPKVRQWVLELKSKGLRPKLEIIAVAPIGIVTINERAYMRRFARFGCGMLNRCGKKHVEMIVPKPIFEW